MDNKKILRLFISSTFDDFSIERDALQNQVFPYISEICYQNGYQFFPIDLRWGVSSEAQVDQKTLDICLKEVDKCISEPHPDFLMLIGNRYGWIPLQNKIEQKEFENIVELLSSDDKYLVANWYELDENENKETYNSFTKIIQGIVKTLDISPSELNDLVNSANGFWQKMYP